MLQYIGNQEEKTKQRNEEFQQKLKRKRQLFEKNTTRRELIQARTPLDQCVEERLINV